MKQYTFTINRDFAMHFGPAGRLAAIAKVYPDTTATIEMGTRVKNISKPMEVATMGIRKGDEVTIKVEGPSEVELFDVVSQYFEEYM